MFNMSERTVIKINFGTALTCVLLLLGWGADRGITGQKLNTILEYVVESKAARIEQDKETARLKDRVSTIEAKLDHVLRAR